LTKELVKKIAKKIKQYDTIIVARHMGPDPDAICSQIALRDSIRLTYPNKKVYAVGIGVSKFKKYGELDKIENKSQKNPLLITLDVPNYYRVDGVDELSPKEIIKIDHHPFEEQFGPLEWVDDTACSTCQLIANLILYTNLKLNENIASNLFLGIVSDSDRFLLSYTTLNTFKTVTSLIERSGINFIKLYEKLYERPINEVKFHGYLGEHLTKTENGLVYVKISSEVLKEYGVDTASPSNMINDFNYIKDVLVWTFVTYDEKNKVYKVNIRSRGPIINEVASKYNGGGHKFASGVRTPNEKDIDNLLKDLDNACKEYQVKN
jgi:phosphoesterase RecJ-like protein